MHFIQERFKDSSKKKKDNSLKMIFAACIKKNKTLDTNLNWQQVNSSDLPDWELHWTGGSGLHRTTGPHLELAGLE